MCLLFKYFNSVNITGSDTSSCGLKFIPKADDTQTFKMYMLNKNLDWFDESFFFKSRVRETKNLSTDADNSIHTKNSC